MKRAAYALAPLGALILLAALAPPAAATHWCGQSAITLGPANPVATRENTFTIHFSNTGIDTTQITSLKVKFPWEAEWRHAGSATVLASQSADFTITATPPDPGAHIIQVNATGTSSGDVLGEQYDCVTSATVNAVDPPAVSPLLLGAAVAAIAVVGVAVVLRRRKKQPPTA